MAEEIGTLWSGRSKRLGLWSDEVDLNGDGLAVSQQTGACGLAHLEHIDELVQRVGSVHSLASEGGDDVARLDTGSFPDASRANFAHGNALLAGETDHLHGRIIFFGHVLDGERNVVLAKELLSSVAPWSRVGAVDDDIGRLGIHEPASALAHEPYSVAFGRCGERSP